MEYADELESIVGQLNASGGDAEGPAEAAGSAHNAEQGESPASVPPVESTAEIIAAAVPAAVIPPPKPQKRGPGRPSKTPAPPSVQMHGVVSTPRFPGSLIELGYANPLAFKSLSTFFEKLKCSEMMIHATPDRLMIKSVDSTEKITIASVVEGGDMNHYYCERELWLSFNFSDVEKVFKSIDRSYNLIKFWYTRADPVLIQIHLCDSSLKKSTQFPISVVEQSTRPTMWDSVMQLYSARADSLISWQLPSKSFKKTNDIAAHTSNTVTVQYTGGSDRLTLEWGGSSFAPNMETYSNFEAIMFRSTLAQGSVLTLKYSTMCGKNLSAAAINDHVKLHCWADKPILAVFEGGGISVAAEMRLLDDH